MDLFESPSELIKIPMSDGDLYSLQSLKFDCSNEDLLSRLILETPWREEKITVWGKTFIQPRLIAWYGDKGKNYTYSGNKFEPLAWTPLLLSIKKKIEEVCKKNFNSVLLNYYRSGLDSLGFHSDDEPELGENPSIASLSLGETRTFIFKHKKNKSIAPMKIYLTDESLIVMDGDIQKNWIHGIPKEPLKLGARVNLTFRYIL
ncbi:alpha-ketoglutarate-dependent dioxygenase AlkB family protein [Methylophilus glucosoxydans]|uniref:Alpha-ketoglutarate-dependent dioxygenase AlkB family protein n=1 Tax=Methylophilus glucosoxydans TaxID=752553 RepID=A0ABW3GQ36_9PROT